MTTGTMKETFYIAPEVIKSGFYDSKADIYSFGIMLWEMWYGKRALTDVEGDVRAVYGEDAERNRPTQVDQDRKKPPPTLQDLMQGCLDEEADKRPDTTMSSKVDHALRGHISTNLNSDNMKRISLGSGLKYSLL